MYLDELLEDKIKFDQISDDFDITTDHFLLFDSSSDLFFNLENKYKRLHLNFQINKNINSKIDIEIYADDILVDSYISVRDKKFSLNCYINNCSTLKIKSTGEHFKALIHDSYLFENCLEHDYNTLSKTKYKRDIIPENNIIIIPINGNNKNYLLNCLNFIKEFSCILDEFKIYILSSGYFPEVHGIAQNFLATEIILPEDNYNSNILNITNYIRANKYIFINPRTMVLDTLQPIVDKLNATMLQKVIIAKEQGLQKLQKLGEILDGTITYPYSGSKSDLELLDISEDIYNSTEIYNGGVFACGHKPLLVINSYIKNNEYKYIKYLNELQNEDRIFAILNTILVKTNLAEELHEKFNVQLYHDGCVIIVDQKNLSFLYKDRKASILHFNGQKSDYKYNKLKNYALEFFKVAPIINKDPGPIKDLQLDYLHMSEILVGKSDLSSDTCIFTIAGKDDIDCLKTLIWSINKNSKLHFPIYIFNINCDSTISAICLEHNCIEIPCQSEADTKCLIFGAQNVIDSNNFIYIDVNCVILESLLESINIFKMLSEDLIYLSSENFKDERYNNLKSLLMRQYNEDPIARIRDFKLEDKFMFSEVLLNPSFFFAKKKVLEKIYNQINNFNSEFKEWSIKTPGGYKFIFNYAIVKLNIFEEIDISFNLVHQYHGRIQIWRDKDKPRAIYHNKFIKIINFEGRSKHLQKYLSIYRTFINKEQTLWEDFVRALDLFFEINQSPNIMPYFYPRSHKAFPDYQLDYHNFLEFLKNIIDTRKCKNVIEAGSGSGLFTAALASILPTCGEVICLENPKYIGHLPFFWYLTSEALNKIKFIAEQPEIALPALIDKGAKYDAIFINGNADLEECFTMSMLGRGLLKEDDPLIIHAPGKDSENIKFISSRMIENGFGVSNYYSKYPDEDVISFMICTNKINLEIRHKITIVTYIDSIGNKLFNFVNNIKNSTYPKDKIQLIILMNKNCPEIQQYFQGFGVSIQTDYMFVEEENSLIWHDALKFYLKNHQNYGMIIWRSNLICDADYIEKLVVANCPVSQVISCTETQPLVKASNLLKYLNTAIYIKHQDLPNYYFVDWVQDSPIFAVKSKWMMLWKLGGFKDMKLETDLGIEGWLFKHTRSKSYLVKNTSAWIFSDNSNAFKAIITNGKTKIYQKRF